MIAHYVQLDSDSLSESVGKDANKSKTITKLKILASILSATVAVLTVALVIVLVGGTPLPSVTITNNGTSEDKNAPPHGYTTASPTSTPQPVCMTTECVSAVGELYQSMDTAINPCDDFYRFSCGKYSNDHPLPVNVDGWSHFYRLTYEVRNNLREQLDIHYDEWDKNYNVSKDPFSFDKLYNFYQGCKNATARNQNGYSGLLSKVRDIGGWPSINGMWNEEEYDWEEAIIKSIRMKHFPLIKLVVTNDLLHANRTILSLGPNFSFDEGFTDDLPNIFETKKPSRVEFYVDTSDVLAQQIKEVISKISKEVKLNSTFADDIDELHKLLYNLRSNVTGKFDSQDFMDYYDNFTCTVKEMDVKFPGINWSRILKSSSPYITDNTLVFVPDLNFFNALPKIISATKTRTLANYIGASLVLNLGRYTTTDLVDVLVNKLDAPEVLPNVCYQLTETFLPNLLGRFYVDKFFNKSWKDDMKTIIDRIHAAFHQTLSSSETDWMDAETKNEAIRKVENIKKNVAYPEWTGNNTLLDTFFDDLFIENHDFFSSALSVLENNQKQNFLLLRSNEHSTDPENSLEWAKDSWPTKKDATYVNAFYYFSTNGIYFPAGIAQIPFYQMNRPMAINLGSIGMIIGHEMTHSLDNSGSLYDYQGDLREWWKPETRQSFDNKSQCFVEQYSNIPDYIQQFNLTVNGVNTVRENIADNGGIRQAYRALENYQTDRAKGKVPRFERLPGQLMNYNEEQLFFISFASMWCSNMEPDSIKRTLESSDHPPERVRVIQSLANFDKFSQAFNCPSGSRMNPNKKCKLW